MMIEPSFDDFAKAYARGEGQIVWAGVAADLDTPVSLMLKLCHGRRDCFMLESVKIDGNRGRYSAIGMKPDLVWRCVNGRAEINRAPRVSDAFAPDERPALESLRALLAESRLPLPHGLPPIAAGLFGYLGYDMARLAENLPHIPPDRLGVPDAILLRPSVVAVVDHAKDMVIFAAPVRPTPGLDARAAWERAAERIADAAEDLERGLPHQPAPDAAVLEDERVEPESNMTPDAYRAIVARAQEYIKAGDIFQVVLSQRWRRPFRLPPFSFYRALRRTNPSSYMFYFDFGGFQVAGASPEILVSYTKEQVKVRPIAGTRPRGATPEEDLALERDLLADPKERAEHLMLVDLGRNDVGRVSRIGTVRPTETFVIERYSHVMHIVSHVTGVPRPDVDALDALLAGMPAGTLSGAPKIRAMEIIDELEIEKRGVYGGGVGYFSVNGDMDACIAIRTGVIKDGVLITQAGGGVVYDSNSEAERQETLNKARAPARAAEEAIRRAGDALRNRR